MHRISQTILYSFELDLSMKKRKQITVLPDVNSTNTVQLIHRRCSEQPFVLITSFQTHENLKLNNLILSLDTIRSEFKNRNPFPKSN